MRCKKLNNEIFVHLDHLSYRIPLVELTQLISQYCQDLLIQEMTDLIIEREKVGDTFIGNRTVVLHVVSSKIRNEKCLYIDSDTVTKWRSLATKQIHEVDQFIVLVINPKSKAHYFKYLSLILQSPMKLKRLTE